MGLFIWPPGNTTFVAEVRPPEIIEEAWYFVFEGNQILLRHDADGRWTPIDSQEWTAMSTVDAVTHYMGRLQGRHCFAVSVAGLPNAQKSGLRGVLGSTDNLMFGLAGRAAQIVDWYRTHRFCGRCGGQNRPHDADRAMICDDCPSLC
jgi:NAD+ diphosphatase